MERPDIEAEQASGRPPRAGPARAGRQAPGAPPAPPALAKSGDGDPAPDEEAGAGNGECLSSVPPDLGVLEDSQRRRALMASTARFAGAFSRWVDSRACGPLTYPRLRVLEALKSGGAARMNDLAAQVGISPRNMTAVADALEKAGLVVRRRHPADRRATLVELTPGGIEAARTTLAPGLDAMADIFGSLTLREQQQFLKVLGRLLDAMQAGDPPSPAQETGGLAGYAGAVRFPVADQSGRE